MVAAKLDDSNRFDITDAICSDINRCFRIDADMPATDAAVFTVLQQLCRGEMDRCAVMSFLMEPVNHSVGSGS
jgi:hypothetical protein